MLIKLKLDATELMRVFLFKKIIMAEEKKGFILYSDIIHTIEKLTDEQAGVLFKHILKYVNDENPECKDLITEIAFEPIKQSLKRDLLKWDDKKQKRSEAGIAGATKRWQNIANDSKRIKPMANIAVSVNDNVNVKDIHKDFNFAIFLDWFNKTTNRNFKSISEATKKSFKARLKEGYTKEDIMKAVINCSKDKFHIENPKYLTPEFISRADKLALYLSAPTETKTKTIIY